MKKHSILSSENLAAMVTAARDLNAKEEEIKQREIAAGRRNEIDDLPTGHPLRVMMEEAKKRHEDRQAKAQSKASEIKTVKKLKPREAAPKQEDPDHASRVRMAHAHNGATQDILAKLESYRKELEVAYKAFHGFPSVRVKIDRAGRAVVAACYAIHESMISTSERG
jgi:hypothetical protein